MKLEDEMNWKVTTFHRRARSGRARPPIVTLENNDGNKIEAYLKSPKFHAKKSCYCLEREWIATRLAEELKLPCARVVPVKVTPQLIQMASKSDGDGQDIVLENSSLSQMLKDGPDLLVGSVSLGTGWSEWSPSATIKKTQLVSASAIYFFDTVIQNWDRSRPNPNLLMKNNDYGMIDNEESFVYAAGLDNEQDYTPIPWKEGGVTNDCGEHDEHPLWQGINSSKNASFGTIVKQWKSLSKFRIQKFAEDVVFEHWCNDVGRKISEYILEAIENIDDIHRQIETNRCR